MPKRARLPLLRRNTVLLNPEKLRRYRIRECLGGGGFGRVYRAKAQHLKHRDVCVKVSRDLETWTAELHWFKVFQRERRVVALLDHFVIQRNGSPMFVLVLEYAHEGSLLDYVARHGPLAERRAVREATSLVATLEKLHGIQGIHRDLTPMNVLVFPRFHLRFADFGIARQALESSRVRGAWTCNPDWVPSEVRRRGRASFTSDIYQMGLVLLYMLTGDDNPPRKAAALETALEAAGVSKPLARILRKALARRPVDRYASCTHMLRDLRKIHVPSARGPQRNGVPRTDRTLRLPLRIYGFRYDTLVHRAVLYKNGEVRVVQPLRKQRYSSLTEAASRLVGYSKSGWGHWYYFDRHRQLYLPLMEEKTRILKAMNT